MKILSLLFFVWALSACSNGGSDSAATQDPIYGTWSYTYPGATSTKAKGIVAKIEKDKLQIVHAYGISDGSSIIYYTRKSEGTYLRDGKNFSITYSYETCKPIVKETIQLELTSSDKLLVFDRVNKVSLSMSRVTNTGAVADSMAAIEDKNCNILSKVEKSENRSVANSSEKSFLAIFDKLPVP